MKKEERELAVRLRTEYHLGYGEIAKRVNVSKGTLSRWLHHMPLSEKRILELRRAGWYKGEVKRERFRNTMRAKREAKERFVYRKATKQFKNLSSDAHFVSGLMLYAAEGEKKSTADISFTNTDPALINFFLEWAIQHLNLPREKFRIQLHLYENMNIPTEEAFWLAALSFNSNQLWKSQVKKLRPKSFSYRDGSRHGTCRLYVGSVPAKTELLLSIRAFFDTHTRRARSSVGRALR